MQKKINNDPYEKPDITIQLDRDSESLTINDCSDIISPFRARVQGGVAVPERDSILKSVNRAEPLMAITSEETLLTNFINFEESIVINDKTK